MNEHKRSQGTYHPFDTATPRALLALDHDEVEQMDHKTVQDDARLTGENVNTTNGTR